MSFLTYSNLDARKNKTRDTRIINFLLREKCTITVKNFNTHSFRTILNYKLQGGENFSSELSIQFFKRDFHFKLYASVSIKLFINIFSYVTKNSNPPKILWGRIELKKINNQKKRKKEKRNLQSKIFIPREITIIKHHISFPLKRFQFQNYYPSNQLFKQRLKIV